MNKKKLILLWEYIFYYKKMSAVGTIMIRDKYYDVDKATLSWFSKGNECTPIEVENRKYNTWLNNCRRNKTKSSWVYFYNPDMRRKVKLIEGKKDYDYILIYYGMNQGDWGVIDREGTALKKQFGKFDFVYHNEIVRCSCQEEYDERIKNISEMIDSHGS